MNGNGRRWGMVIDASRCTGCFNCHLACRDEHAGIDHLPLARAQPAQGGAWIEVRLEERGSYPKVKLSRVPVPCLQCEEAPCLTAARGGAVYRRADGIVVIDPAKAAGQRQLVAACPHHAIAWNEALQLAQKCSFCAHLLDQGWTTPRCVEACPTEALRFGDIGDPSSEISRLRQTKSLQPLQAPGAASTAVMYAGLPTRFISGEIAFADRDEEPARDVVVRLHGGRESLTLHTDAFGDFAFEGLDHRVDYHLTVEHAGYRRRELTISAGDSFNVGTLFLQPAC